MASARTTKRELLRRFLADTRLERVTEADFSHLRERLAPISEGYLRGLLRDCGLALDPVVEGVRQESFGELGRTLRMLAVEYEVALGRGDCQRADRCRDAVLIARPRQAGIRFDQLT